MRKYLVVTLIVVEKGWDHNAYKFLMFGFIKIQKYLILVFYSDQHFEIITYKICVIIGCVLKYKMSMSMIIIMYIHCQYDFYRIGTMRCMIINKYAINMVYLKGIPMYLYFKWVIDYAYLKLCIILNFDIDKSFII